MADRTLTYRDSGVDVSAGAALVGRIAPLAESTKRPGALGALGGFGGLFDLRAAGFEDPVLVAATDGVGTKLRVAIEAGRHGTVGIDLVAMCVNDLVVQGAEPLFFLDYFATGKLDSGVAEAVVAGVARGCKEADCALIGGETAEMPGMYAGSDYDLAGFAVGAVERGALLPRGSDIAEGDALLGLASSGLHANGFSLMRRILEENGIGHGDAPPFAPERTWRDVLLEPTRIYARSCLALHAAGLAKGFAHVTGGGFLENVPRILPEGLSADLASGDWTVPSPFRWLVDAAGVSTLEMAGTFNCGVGMVVVVAAEDADGATGILRNAGETVYRLGRVRARGNGERVVPPETAWRA